MSKSSHDGLPDLKHQVAESNQMNQEPDIVFVDNFCLLIRLIDMLATIWRLYDLLLFTILSSVMGFRPENQSVRFDTVHKYRKS